MSASPVLADVRGLDAYLHARVLDGSGQAAMASADYARALAADPDNALVAVRAYRAALNAGDDALAGRAIAVMEKAGMAPADAPLIAAADAARADDPAGVEAAAARLATGPLRILTPALRDWAGFARTHAATAVATGTADPLAGRLAGEVHALILIAAERVEDGVGAIRAMDPVGGNRDVRIAASQLLAGQNRIEEARALLSGDTPGEQAFRQGVPARPTLAFGVSRLFTRVAGQLSSDGSGPLLVALTRAALRADANDDRARLVLAGALARGGEPDAALAVLVPVGEKSPVHGLAAATRISILNGDGREKEALAASETRARAPDATTDDWQRYADLLLTAGRPADAVPFYRRAVDAQPNSWQAWMQYGGALDEAGDWPQARTALQKALSLAPNEPLTLNYLGYTQLEHGEAVAASTRLIERASALAPQNADILDSLGWAYHLSGASERALPLLQRAVAAQPAAVEINEHLGDVYWTLGRRYEARYAWRAASVVADPDATTRLANKIANGVPVRS